MEPLPLFWLVLREYWELGEQPMHNNYPYMAYNHVSEANGPEYDDLRAEYLA